MEMVATAAHVPLRAAAGIRLPVAVAAGIQLPVAAAEAEGIQLPVAAAVVVDSTPLEAIARPIADDKNFEVLLRAAPQAALFFCL